MCVFSMTSIGTALGLSASAIASATTASANGISALGVATGVANGLLATALLGSTAMGIGGSLSSAQQAQAQANYQAEVARENAKIADKNAKEERQSGLIESRNRKIKMLSQMAAQRAGIASNGIDISSGTAVDVIEDTAMVGELDAITAQYNAEKRALNYEQQAGNFTNQANLDVLRGQQASQSGTINAIGNGLSGLSKIGTTVASGWSNFNTNSTPLASNSIQGTPYQAYSGINNNIGFSSNQNVGFNKSFGNSTPSFNGFGGL